MAVFHRKVISYIIVINGEHGNYGVDKNWLKKRKTISTKPSFFERTYVLNKFASINYNGRKIKKLLDL